MPFIHKDTVINLSTKTGDGKYFTPDSGLSSFTLEESIYSLDQKASLYFSESSGRAVSLHLFDPGFEFHISYAVGPTKLNKIGKLFSSSFKGTINPLKYSPKISLKLHPSWEDEVSKISRVFKNKRISEVVSSLASDQSFQTDINDTGNFHTWYRTNETHKEFLNRISQYCYSDNANNTPFFLYQTLDDVVHLRNAFSLENQKSKLTFTMTFATPRTEEIGFTITDLQRIDDGSFNSRHLSRIDACTINRTTGAVEFLSNKQSEHLLKLGIKKYLFKILLMMN